PGFYFTWRRPWVLHLNPRDLSGEPAYGIPRTTTRTTHVPVFTVNTLLHQGRSRNWNFLWIG
ncbi:hypothetical protein GOODEAATRI_012555, partial [Goodea atripinnis]